MSQKMNWSKGTLIALMRIYARFRILYDDRHIYYYDKQKKMRAYEEMLRLIWIYRPGTTIDELKAKIRSLRTQFMNERNRLRKTETKVPRLWCYNHLSFLASFQKIRRVQYKEMSITEESQSNSVFSICPSQTEIQNTREIMNIEPQDIKKEPESFAGINILDSVDKSLQNSCFENIETEMIIKQEPIDTVSEEVGTTEFTENISHETVTEDSSNIQELNEPTNRDETNLIEVKHANKYDDYLVNILRLRLASMVDEKKKDLLIKNVLQALTSSYD